MTDSAVAVGHAQRGRRRGRESPRSWCHRPDAWRRGCGRTRSRRVPASVAVPTPATCSGTDVVVDRRAGCSVRRWPRSCIGSGVSSSDGPTTRSPRSLRQAGFVDVTPDEYRTRTAVQVLAFGAAGTAFGVVVFHRPLAAVGLGVCGVVFGASRLRGKLERGDRRPA